MREQISCRDSTNQVPEMTAAGAIVEAQGTARKIVEHERGACGGSTELAIYRASSLYGVDETSIRALWHRRARKFAASHVMDALRQADKYLEARAARERAIIADVADTLERCGSPAARIARKIAEIADEGVK